MKKAFDFTGQGKADAVVPLLIGDMHSKYSCPDPSTRLEVQHLWIPEDRRSRFATWQAVWGLFQWSVPDEPRPYLAEVWGLRSLSLHDFCGGSNIASIGAHVWMPSVHFAYGPGCYTVKGVEYFAKMCSYEDYQWLPDLRNAYADPDAVSLHDVENTLLRSMMFWMLGIGAHHNRVALSAYDRRNGKITQAAMLANSLRYMPTNLFPMSYSNETSPMEQAATRPETLIADWFRQPDGEEENIEDYGDGYAIRCDPTGDAVSQFINANSRAECSLLFLTPNRDTRTRDVLEGGTQYTPYSSIPMMIPKWWSDVAGTNRYDRIFPRQVFTH